MSFGDSCLPLKSIEDLTGYAAGVGASVTSGSPFFGTAVLAPVRACRMTLTIAVDTNSTLSVAETTRSGVYELLNSGAQLTAGCLYYFSFGVGSGQRYNFKLGTTSVVTWYDLEAVFDGI